MDIRRIVCGAYAENAYIIDDKYIVDPGDDFEALFRALPDAQAIFLTHGHFDHMLAAGELQKAGGAQVYVHPKDAPMLTDAELCAYDAIASRLAMPKEINARDYPDEVCGFRVLHTPGHTPGSVCLYNEAEKALFSGDTLFRAGYGRYDLPGGSVRELIGSLDMLLALPEDTVVYPGHGDKTTIGDERRRYGR